jgi:hypothetical protein
MLSAFEFNAMHFAIDEIKSVWVILGESPLKAQDISSQDGG